jgi:hypothetical protein
MLAAWAFEISQVPGEHLPAFRTYREHVGFAEFTGRDVRMPVSLRPCGPFSSSLFIPGLDDSGARQVVIENLKPFLISLPDWNLGKDDNKLPEQGPHSQSCAAPGNATAISEFASKGENPEVGLCLEIGLPN